MENSVRMRFSAEREQFYGQYIPKDGKAVEIAKCVPPLAINFVMWNVDNKGLITNIYWYNIGVNSNASQAKISLKINRMLESNAPKFRFQSGK